MAGAGGPNHAGGAHRDERGRVRVRGMSEEWLIVISGLMSWALLFVALKLFRGR